MQSKSELRKFYNAELMPDLETFEARRKGIIRNIFIAVGVVVAILIVLAVLFVQTKPVVLLVGAVVGVLIVAITTYFSMGDYTSAFKKTVIERVVKFVDPGLDYSPTRSVSQGDFMASRLFEHRIDRYKGEDYVSGTLEKTTVRFSEIHAEYKTESRDSKGHKRTHWHTIFKGLFFVGDFNKEFSGITVVVPDIAERTLGKWLGQALQSINATRSGELIKLEDPEFEKNFAVYGDDQVEARYILTPALMRRLLAFRSKSDRDIFVSFAHSNVYIGIMSSRDMFEPRLFRTLLDFSMIEEYFDDLTLAVGIVEDLNLNTRIWTKE